MISKLIELKKRSILLLEELRESQEFERVKSLPRPFMIDELRKGNFIIFDMTTEQARYCGTFNEISAWMERRAITNVFFKTKNFKN